MKKSPKLVYDAFEIPIGWVGIVHSPIGITNCYLTKTFDLLKESLQQHSEYPRIQSMNLTYIKAAVTEYFMGNNASLQNIPLDIPDNAPQFFSRAWDACRSIPVSETRSYAWLASHAGNSKAVRAAGQSMRRNKIPLFIPCHRVIHSDSTIGNYTSGGAAIKEYLLSLESKYKPSEKS
jgi:O-6-methylguanine DNA methyltransferase